jgi:hypothetical protein
MKTQRILFAAILLALNYSFCIAQPGPGPGFGNNGYTKYISGDVKMLLGQTSLNVRFSYDNMLVGELTEDAYIKQKTNEQNRMKSGSGDTWAAKWTDDRVARFEPEFLNSLNLAFKKIGIVANSIKGEATTTYILLVKTTKIEPGVLFSGPTGPRGPGFRDDRQESYINIQVDIVEAANPSNVIGSISSTRVVGKAAAFANYDSGLRIANAYSEAGKNIGSFIVKNCR